MDYNTEKFVICYMLYVICDPLSKNTAYQTFYENRYKTRNQHINVYIIVRHQIEWIGCLVPELRSKKHCGFRT